MATFSCDFETTTIKEDCRVWAWGYADILEPENVKFGIDIDSFMSEVSNNGGRYYFHNLKFDGNFILYWLFRNGYKWVSDKRNLGIGEFTTTISDMGSWYTVNVCMKPSVTGVVNKVEFRDSLKIIPLAVEDIPNAFGIDDKKLDLDYNTNREKGHELTDNEKEYLKNDVIIVAKAIRFMLDNGQKKLTSASNALYDFKTRLGAKQFKKYFPELDYNVDKDIRASYKGGWTYLNPEYKDKNVKCGRVYDVNSMYSWAMKYCLLPYGIPYFFSGKYKENSNYPLYVSNFVCEFKLKPGKLPTIQLKNTPGYLENEYLTCSNKPTVLTLTSIDLKLFFENYYVDVIEWCYGYMFKAKVGIFAEYIDYWYSVKTEAKKTGNKGMEKIAKLMLNSLYGKFGARMRGRSKIPYYDEELGKVRFRKSDEENRKATYLPVATFITSYCRDKIIRGAQVCGNRFIYADTDSLHIEGNSVPNGLDIDNYRLGAFKLEEEFVRAKFIRQKTYLEVYLKDGKEKINLKCCGMPEKMKNTISENEFYEGAEYAPKSLGGKYAPKLIPEVVPGGVILKETTFKIKKPKTVATCNVIISEDEIITLDKQVEI